jgi:hypothetical protein
MSYRCSAFLVIALLTTGVARAETRSLSIEGDATRLALGSLSFHLMLRLAEAPRLRLGVGRVGGALPGVFHRLFDPNEGWSVTEQGAAAQVFYHLEPEGSTLFVGAYLRFDRWEWRRDDMAGVDRSSQLFPMPAIGYRWFPTDSGVFVSPWAGMGFSVWHSGAGKLGPHVYKPLEWFPILAIHVGYEG